MRPTRRPVRGRSTRSLPSSLVLRARRGDEVALNDLFERYSKRLRIWAHGRLPVWREDRPTLTTSSRTRCSM